MNINSINPSSSSSVSPQVKLSLNPGQIINAQIIKSEGSQIMLQYGGYLFKAQTDMALKPGEKLRLSVESVKDHVIHLKIIDGKESKQPQSITALLLPGLKPDSNMETIARQLTKFNLPVSLEFLTELNKFLKRNKLSADIGQLVVWLKSAGIEVNAEQDIRALQVLYKFFQGELANEQESRYFDLLNGAENQFAGGVNIYGWPLANHHVYLIKEGSKNETLSAENCKIAVKANSAAFQELWFVIEFVDHNLTANIFCTAEEFKKILEAEAPSFKSALAGSGYQVNHVAVKVNLKKAATIFDLLPEKEINNINIKI
jgi:hypothetical protein